MELIISVNLINETRTIKSTNDSRLVNHDDDEEKRVNIELGIFAQCKCVSIVHQTLPISQSVDMMF